MKVKTTFLKRCLSWVVALALLVSSANLGWVLQEAHAEGAVGKNYGEIVAENYELTEAEAALLKGGYLKGGKVSYEVPSDAQSDLITIDNEENTLAVEKFKGWVPVSADIMVGETKIETVKLVDGKGSYTYESNAFSVVVNYELTTDDITVDAQETMLSTIGWLKDGIAMLEDVKGQDGNLYILEQAMPELVAFANKGINAGFTTVQLSAECKAAVAYLDAQMAANGGTFILRKMIAEYISASKTEYLLGKGTAMHDEVNLFAGKVMVISEALCTIADNLEWVIEQGFVDAATAESLKTLAAVTTNLYDALAILAASEWTAAEKGTALLADEEVNYVKLDEALAAIETVTALPELKADLLVETAAVQKNLAMWNVTINVVLETTQNNKVAVKDTVSGMITLAANATKDEILKAVEVYGIEADALSVWEDYVEGKFTATKSELPNALTSDIEYTITYSPKNYTVSFDYEASKSLPYGYELKLPVHGDATKAYDYTVNGVKYAQGDVVVINGETNISRTAGKAYAINDLYSIVADNYGSDIAKAILKSGALFGNEAVNVRKPDPAEAESLLTLMGGKLTAKDYLAAYAGLSWIPYTYGAEGTENEFSGNEATGLTGNEVKVQYKLSLTNIGKAKAQSILDLAAQLKAEADAQLTQLNRLNGQYATMEQLNRGMLGGMNGTIDVTDFTPGDGNPNDAKNLELRAYFKNTVTKIINNNVVNGGPDDGALKIFVMIREYNTDGLRYYYNNSEELINEINNLVSYLGEMTKEQEALTILLMAVNKAEYAEKIGDLEQLLTEVKAGLTAPNEAINLKSDNLGKLLEALEMSGSVTSKATDAPYLLSDKLTALSDDQVNLQIIIETPAGSSAITSDPMDIGAALTQSMINDLLAKANAEVAKLLGDNVKYYADDKQALPTVGTAIEEKLTFYWNYSLKEYTVKIEGEADQTITVDHLEVNLPKHPTTGWTYKYTVDGVADITTSTYTFTTEQIDRLFADGIYTITREATNEAAEKLENAFGDWLIKDAEGTVTGIHAQIVANQGGVMEFAMALLNSGYSYIALNNEPLMYMSEDNSLEICLQTLMNAILNDETFGSDKLISLGQKGQGEVITAEIQLGGSADDIYFKGPFKLSMNQIPGMMATVANGLAAVKDYVSFKSDNGVIAVKLNLPAKVYEVYLAALLTTGNIDKSDVNAINSEIAFRFLWDYVDTVLKTDANTTTFTKTLAKFGQSYDLTGAEEYFQLVEKALNNPGLTAESIEDGNKMMISIKGKSQSAINGLINMFGFDVSAYATYLGMIKEYKYADAEVGMNITAALTNTASDYDAAVIDLGASGITNKVGFTKDLVKAKIAGPAAVILLDDVDGNLTFSGTTILDLNGKTVNGNITANGKLIIIDSCMGTAKCGVVTGKVSGSVTILGGKYAPAASVFSFLKKNKTNDVSSFLMDGYIQNADGTVQNKLYVIEEDANGNLSVVINTDFIKEDGIGYVRMAEAVAIDLAIDLALNYYTSAGLYLDGNKLYAVNFDDLVGLITSKNKVDDLINEILGCFNIHEMGEAIEIILDDMLDFAGAYNSLANDKILSSYDLTFEPWKVAVSHNTAGDYLTFGIVSNDELAKTINVSLKLEGSYVDYVSNMLKVLAEINNGSDVEIDLSQPIYNGASNNLSAQGSTNVIFDIDLYQADEALQAKYAKLIAAVLKKGGCAQSAALEAAAVAGDMVAFKKALDKVSVADIFTALKKLDRNDTTAPAGVDADLWRAYHLTLVAAGKALEVLDITGYASTLGGLDKDGDGLYVLAFAAKRDGSVGAAGYSVYADIAASFTLQVRLFCDHKYDANEWKSDDTYHWNECEICHGKVNKTEHTWGEWVVVTPGDCLNPGEQYHVCEICDHVETAKSGEGNHVLGAWQYDDEYHWRVCEKCNGIVDKAEHDYAKISDEFEQCSVCGHKHKLGSPDLGDYVLTTFGVLAGVSAALLAVMYVYKRRKRAY